MNPFSSSFLITRPGELATARRFLLAGSVAHAAAAVIALGAPTHPAWAVAAPFATVGRPAVAAAIGLASLLLAVLGALVAVGLGTRESWAPRCAYAVAVAGLLNAPFGTLASLLSLAFLSASLESVPSRRASRRRARTARASG